MYSVFLWSVSRLTSLLNNESGSSRSCPKLVLSDKRLYSFLYYNRAIFNSVSKVIQDCFGFALFRYGIGPENLRHFLDQPDSKVWTIATWSLAFSRASGSSRDFTSSSNWLLAIFSWLLWLLGFWIEKLSKVKKSYFHFSWNAFNKSYFTYTSFLLLLLDVHNVRWAMSARLTLR